MNTAGVISFQGDFHRHISRVRELGAHALGVRDPRTLEQVDALVIPGGESTTIGMLLDRFGLLAPIRRRIADGMPVFGTCAGAILLADEIADSHQERIGGFHAVARRNAYGRQIESFEAKLEPTEATPKSLAGDPITGVFIRAPILGSLSDDVQVMFTFEEHPVMARQDNILVATFHPELTVDPRIHAWFLREVAGFTLS